MRAEDAGRAPLGVSAIIVNYDGGPLLLECIASLEGQGLLETIVVDNGSHDGSAAAARSRYPGVAVLSPGRNLGFAEGANVGAWEARGELLLFLNPDIRLGPGVVRALADELGESSVGVVGPPLRVAGAKSVEYGATVDVIGSPVPLDRPGRPLYIPGCALMTRAKLFRELGGFDGRLFMFVEDVDYCWRVLVRGFDVKVAEVDPVWHEGGAAAPGGYIRRGRLTSTSFRVALRERNTLTVLLKCYGTPLVCVVAPVYVLQSLATAGMLAAWGRRATARAVVAGLLWNFRELRRTLELRRQVQRSRRVGDAAILRRMHRGIWKLSLLRRFGVPSVAEEGPSVTNLGR
jgi:GT2 family glycosyltransferase